MSPRAWFRFAAQADNTTAEIAIFGDIGKSYWDDDAVSAKQFLDTLKALPASVAALTVRVNSLGGSAFDGVAIANALRTWQRAVDGRSVTTIVEGIAASAASVVIMAGSTIQIADNALVMIHKAWSYEVGNADRMRKIATALDKVDAAIVATYRWHSGQSEAAILQLMADETWMTAAEAVAHGLATETVQGLQAAACLDPRAMAALTIPEAYRDRVQALLTPEPTAPVAAAATEVLRLCREGGCLEAAEALIAAQATPEHVTARIAEERTARAQAAERTQAITHLCATATVPELAAGYVSGGMTLDAVKAHVLTISAVLDGRVEINTQLDPDARGGSSAPRLNVSAIYAARNRPTKES